jgi:hypothetical protein
MHSSNYPYRSVGVEMDLPADIDLSDLAARKGTIMPAAAAGANFMWGAKIDDKDVVLYARIVFGCGMAVSLNRTLAADLEGPGRGAAFEASGNPAMAKIHSPR